MNETYENLKQLLNMLEYSKYGWHICGDLKVMSLLVGLQLGEPSGTSTDQVGGN